MLADIVQTHHWLFLFFINFVYLIVTFQFFFLLNWFRKIMLDSLFLSGVFKCLLSIELRGDRILILIYLICIFERVFCNRNSFRSIQTKLNRTQPNHSAHNSYIVVDLSASSDTPYNLTNKTSSNNTGNNKNETEQTMRLV